MSADSGDKVRATTAETAIKSAMTAGVTGLNAAIMTTGDYEPSVSPNLARDANRATAVGLFEAMRTLPVRLPIFTILQLPAAGLNTGAIVYCSNGAAGSPVVAFSNGTAWLRVDTLAAVS